MLSIIIIILSIIDYNNDVHLRFSEESGYYDDTLNLKIWGQGKYVVYYTLDGSAPTVNDYIYNSEDLIVLRNATYNDNVYSARTDTSVAFMDDLVDKYCGTDRNPYYTIPNYNVDKCNIVRAAVFDEEGNCLDAIEGAYFVGLNNKSVYDEIYTASIVTDPENLFGYETGIYNTGIAFDTYRNTELGREGWSYDFYNQNWNLWFSNYTNRGIDSERTAIATIFNENKELILPENCGIRIQGEGSRGRLPKSIGCYAREIYGESNEFQANLFQINIFTNLYFFQAAMIMFIN